MKADNNSLKQLIGRRIAAARALNDVSQARLAEKLGFHKMTVSKWERGVQTPDGDAIYALCKALNVSADYILGLSDSVGA